MKIEDLASIFTVIFALFTVVYSGDSYDIWDASIAVFVLYVCHSFKCYFSESSERFAFARIGFSLSIMIIFLVIFTAISPDGAKDFIGITHFNILDQEFFVFLLCLIVSIFTFKKKPNTAIADVKEGA